MASKTANVTARIQPEIKAQAKAGQGSGVEAAFDRIRERI